MSKKSKALMVLTIAIGFQVSTAATASANSRCFEPFSHEHGWGPWRTTDAFSWNRFEGNQAGVPTWYFDHENSDPVWCMGFY
jgi:hypothetical protein